MKEEQEMPAEKADPNYTDMTDPELLRTCGDDGMAWASAFCQIKSKMDWTLDDIDEGLMVGWFANVIEQSTDVRTRRGRPALIPRLHKPLNGV